MKLQKSLKVLSTGLAALTICAAAPAFAQEKLRFAYFTSENEVTYVRWIKPAIEAINSDPSNAVKIELYPNGALGKVLPQQAQMVLDGVADIAFVVPSLAAGRFPDDTLLELPGLIRSVGEGTKLYHELSKGGHLRGYQDYVVLATVMNTNSSMYSRKPISSLADLKGLKARMIGPIGGQIAKELGMVPVQMAPTEVVEAIGRGTIDAAQSIPSALVDFGMDRVTKHDYTLQLNSVSFALLMSKAKFNSLPKPAQDTLMKHAGTWMNDRFVKAMSSVHEEINAKLKAGGGRTIVEPSPADQSAADAAFARVIADWTTKAPGNAKLLETARAVLAAQRK